MEQKLDARTRTPPHGDPLSDAGAGVDAAIDRQTRKIAAKISSRTPVAAEPIYRALRAGHSDRDIEAAIGRACAGGINPANFARFLPLGAATARAMADPEIPHNEAGVPIMPGDPAPFSRDPDCYLCNTASRGTWICEGHLRERAIPAELAHVGTHRLPSHIERAAREAYRRGWQDRAPKWRHRRDDQENSQRGVDVFRKSLERDAAEAVSAAKGGAP